MNISKELQQRINIYFENNEEIRKKLLLLDADAIRQVGAVSQKGMNPEDVIAAYESNDSETMKYLYEKAKKMVELQELYKVLCNEYGKSTSNRSGNEER